MGDRNIEKSGGIESWELWMRLRKKIGQQLL